MNKLGYVSKGDDQTKQPGLVVQYQFGCQKDENGECFDCGQTGEVDPAVCEWGCQVKSPEKGCYSFWAKGISRKVILIFRLQQRR